MWKKLLTGFMIAGVCTVGCAMNVSAAEADANAVAAVSESAGSVGAAQKAISDCAVTVTLNSYVYDGTQKVATVVVKDGNKTLVNGTDYTIGGPPIIFGTQPVIVYGKGNYTGSVTNYVTVTKPIDKCDVTVTLNSYVYDGTQKVPTVVVKDGNKTLVKGTDYTIGGPPIYSGTQPVVVYGKGNYTGSVTKNVTVTKPIDKCNVTVTLNSYVYDGTQKVATVVVKDGNKTLVNGTDFTLGGPPIYSGTQPVVVFGKGNYSGSVTKNVTIQPASIATSDITITPSAACGYLDPATNKVRNAVFVTVELNGKTRYLTNGSNYTVSYSDYSDGMVSVKVTLCGAYKGYAYSQKFQPTAPAFVWGQDNVQFGNSANATGLTYSVEEAVFNAMADKFHLTDAERTTVKKQIAAANKTGMKGRCSGMSSTTILSKLGFLKLSDFSDNNTALSDITYQNSENRTMVSVVNFMQAMWSSVGYREIEVNARSLVSQNANLTKQMQGTYIKRIVDELENENSLLKLCYMTSGQNSHAVTAYGVEPYQYHSDRTGRDYNYRILLCDPGTVLTGNARYSECCIYVYKPASGAANDYYYELSNGGSYWTANDTNYGGIFGAFKLYSLTDEYNILNTRYSKCFVENENGNTTYDYRIVVPSGGKRVLIGDVNLDGQVDILDCTVIQRYLVKMTSLTDLQLVNADVNLDGRIDVRDATYLQRKIAGFYD